MIAAPIEKVWAAIRPLNFKFLSAVQSSAVPETLEIGAIRPIQYKDGTLQKYKIVEASDLLYFITYDLIESTPAIRFLSAIHTIKLRKVSHVSGGGGVAVFYQAKANPFLYLG